MARYIDADKLLEKAEEIEWFNESTGFYDHINIVHKYDVETAPTADVVPKSEVEELSGKYEDLKLKYAELQKDKDELIAWSNDKKTEAERWRRNLEAVLEEIPETKREVAREIFEEIENFIPRFKVGYFSYMSLTDGIAKLKKKYTEGVK